MNEHKRMSYSLVEETCPILDELGYDLIDNLSSLFEDSNRVHLVNLVNQSFELSKKYCTLPLRDALNEKCRELIEARAEILFLKNKETENGY